METRADFQRLLEDMDKAIETKRQELSELDERLESARGQLSEKEAQELLQADQPNLSGLDEQQLLIAQSQQQTISGRSHLSGLNRPLVDEYLKEQSKLYEQQLERFGEELSEFETINLQLVAQNEGLGCKLANCLDELEKSKVNSKSMKENFEEMERANFGLNLRLARAESELSRNQKLLKRTNEQDEVLMFALNDKLEALKQAIELRDEEIKRLQSNRQLTLDRFDNGSFQHIEEWLTLLLSPSDRDGNIDGRSDNNLVVNDKRMKQVVIEIAKVLKDKDKQIELLKGQLLQATNDLEQNANLLAMMKEHHRNQQLEQVAALDPSTSGADKGDRFDQYEELLNRYQIAENELEAKDRQLHLAEFRIHHYEMILPNMISDLVRKLATTSAHLTSDSLLLLLTKSNAEQIDNRQLKREGPIKSLMEELAVGLSRLPGELSAARALLDNIDQLRGANEVKDTQIERLVDELNQLDVKFKLVQQQCDLLRRQQPARDQPIATKSRKVSGLESDQSSDPLDNLATQDVEMRTDRLVAARHLRPSSQQLPPPPPECQVPPSGTSLQASLNSRSGLQKNSNETSISISGAPPPPSATKAAVQLDEHLESVNASSKRSISVSGQQVAFAGVPALDQRQQRALGSSSPSTADGTSKLGTSQVTTDSNNNNNNNNRLSIGDNNDPGAKENSKMLSELNNGSLEQVAERDELPLLQKRLKQVENENELLELAMKEILLSIKWSDSQCSTILIDCPSLERLCQLIEARFLTRAVVGGQRDLGNAKVDHKIDKDEDEDLAEQDLEATPGVGSTMANRHLFQMIVLKSELDLLRGQNEQLRADVKIHRRDYQELLRFSARFDDDLQRLQDNERTDPPGVVTKAQDAFDSATGQQVATSPKAIECNNIGQVDKERSATTLVNGNKLPASSKVNDGSPNNETTTSNKFAFGDRCSNCAKLTNLINHLFKCIVRLENRVNISEETYMSRLLSLRSLIEILERDLSTRASLLNKSQGECHSIRRQKISLETRLQFAEAELSFHLKICPMMMMTTGAQAGANLSPSPLMISNGRSLVSKPEQQHQQRQQRQQLAREPPETCVINAGNRLQVFTTNTTTTQGGSTGSTHSLTSISGDFNGAQRQVDYVPTMRSARLTISLLQSIIGCLQARLDYKDERLRNLESTISASRNAFRSSASKRLNETGMSPRSSSNQQEIVNMS